MNVPVLPARSSQAGSLLSRLPTAAAATTAVTAMTTSSVSNNNGGGGQANSTRNCSPDTDSAFCDNLSVLSSCSASSGEKKGGGGSSGHSSGGSNHAVDEDARIKAEKIKLAIEKIKEASVKKLFIKVE
jgi:hypothetical protein